MVIMPIDFREKNINIPVYLCEHVLKNKYTSQFKVYLALRKMCSGKIYAQSINFAYIKLMTGLSVKQIGRHIKSLLKYNWIGFNNKSKFYFIRGTRCLLCKIGSYNTKSVKISIRELKNIKEFCFAAVVGYWVKKRKYKERFDKQNIRTLQSRGSNQYVLCQDAKSLIAFNSDMIASSSISQRLGMSKSTVSLLKEAAVKAGYLIANKNYISLKTKKESWRQLQRGLPMLRGRFRFHCGEMKIVHCDSFETSLLFYSRT